MNNVKVKVSSFDITGQIVNSKHLSKEEKRIIENMVVQIGEPKWNYDDTFTYFSSKKCKDTIERHYNNNIHKYPKYKCNIID